MSILNTILDLGLGVVSKKASKKQEEKYKKMAEENKRKFMIAWEEKYGKGLDEVEGRKPLSFFEDDKDE